MGFAEEVAEDFDAAVDQLRAATDEGPRRRAIKAILDEVYRLREHRKKQLGGDAYLQVARADAMGRIVEGLSALRTVPTHSVAELVRVLPEPRPLYPQEGLYPSEDLYPGKNLTWVPTAEMDEAPEALTRRSTGDKDTSPFYDSDLAGLVVLPSLASARIWLITDQFLGPL